MTASEMRGVVLDMLIEYAFSLRAIVDSSEWDASLSKHNNSYLDYSIGKRLTQMIDLIAMLSNLGEKQ